MIADVIAEFTLLNSLKLLQIDVAIDIFTKWDVGWRRYNRLVRTWKRKKKVRKNHSIYFEAKQRDCFFAVDLGRYTFPLNKFWGMDVTDTGKQSHVS